jgi:hypothetical protein
MKFSSSEIKQMCIDLQKDIILSNLSESELKEKHNPLKTAYPTLFDMVIKLSKENKTTELSEKLGMMLHMLQKIEKGKIAPNDADIQIGKKMADEYLPKFPKEPK